MEDVTQALSEALISLVESEAMYGAINLDDRATQVQIIQAFVEANKSFVIRFNEEDDSFAAREANPHEEGGFED